MTSVVLVHGAFHGAWCWELVEEGLARRGISSVVPELPFTGIVDDAATARAAIDRAAAAGPVVVCGHSYGGRVISQAASGHPAVQHLVYLTAVQSDESVPLGDAPEPVGVMTTFRTGDDGTLYLDGEAAAPYFFHDCGPAIAKASVAKLRAMDVGPTEPLPADAVALPSAWRSTPSTYVVCTDDRIIDPRAQRAMGRQASSVVEIPTSHSPMLSRPELVVAILADVAESVALS
jgi:pimeloyl-ACP methyl ester carboxylesterase